MIKKVNGKPIKRLSWICPWLLPFFLAACLRGPVLSNNPPTGVITYTPALLIETPTAKLTPIYSALSTPTSAMTVSRYTFEIIAAFPHDPQAFTEGLVFHNGFLYESTGLNGESSLRKVDLESGSILEEIKLDAQYFGEGITITDDQIIQLTWKSNIGFVYDLQTFDFLSDFSYSSEGWGLTFDGAALIMSDGTSVLHFLEPGQFNEIGQIQVHDGETPITQINELEFVDGKIYANIWQTDWIAIIDPQDGLVTGWIDLTGILNRAEYNQPVDVLNGIAYDANEKRLFVTGKYWPKLFEIHLVPRE
jgi:glutaminyl-peptide cyclotransferase